MTSISHLGSTRVSKNHDHQLNLFLSLLIIGSLFFISSCSGLEDTTGGEQTDVAAGAANNTPKVLNGDEAEWTVILYQDADDDVLEEDMYYDLNEAEKVGSSKEVNIISQFDRYDGAFKGDGNWTTAKRFYVTHDDDLDILGSKELEDLGEVNMSDGDTLADYVAWAIQNYPAKKYALILSDHGMGWPGGWTDPDPDEEDQLYLNEITAALATVQKETGVGKLEFIGFDACLMSQLEVFAAIQPYANYSVASEETEPAMGWAYQSFLTALEDDASMSGGNLAQAIVSSYVVDDERITDADARAELMGDSTTTADEAASEYGNDVTLSAVDLSAIPALIDSLNLFSNTLAEADQADVAQARAYAQSYESVFGDEEPASYIDLGNFASLAGELTGSEEVVVAGTKLESGIKDALIAEKHGDDRPGSTGITIYFPVSDLYTADDLSGVDTYLQIADQFATESNWDDFLSYHYGLQDYQPIEGSIAKPESTAGAVAPGAEALTMDPIDLTSDTVSEDSPITFSTTVYGNKVGFIYSFIGYYDKDSNSILVADKDFVFADDTKEFSGIYYPDWGDSDNIPVEFEWDGSIFNISDGENSEFALIEPADYGAADESPTYSVMGMYTFADSAAPISAVMYFVDGEMVNVYGYSGDNGTGGMSEIIPQEGDQFTILQQWINLGEEANSEVTYDTQEGGTLTFGSDHFTWESVMGFQGEYVVGFIAEDLDGNQYSEYTQVNLE